MGMEAYEKNSKLPLTAGTILSNHDCITEGCNNQVETRLIGGKPFWNTICTTCIEKEIAKKLDEDIRRRDLEQIQRIDARIDKVVPCHFRKARLTDFPDETRVKLLCYPPDIGMVLYGPPGRGKTHMMCALIRHFIEVRKEDVIRVTYEMLCLQIRDTYKASSKKTEFDVIHPLIEVKNLVIEDVGIQASSGKSETDFSSRVLYVLLDSRLERCKPTFLTTNKNKTEFKNSFGERIASRLSMFKWLGVGGEDKRK